MSVKNFFAIVHFLGIIVALLLISIFLPLLYIKYIAWIPLAIVFSWVIFNGCIIDKLHHDNANIGTNMSDNLTPLLKLFSNTFANYIFEKYLKNTNRLIFITSFYFTFIVTLMCYRLIYNIDFIKLQSKEV
jgi:hypothetical protein